VWDAASKIVVGDVPPDPGKGIGANPGWPDSGADPSEWWLTDPGNDVDPAVQAPDDNSFTGNGLPERHNDGTIYGFIDGHVKWARERQLDQPKYWIPSQQ
ncbi:MAG: hypothetical protein H5T86_15170, partial [Armatimonadetes bacterium]|nr:hypothetical protein [Armatimonadota bacterium]